MATLKDVPARPEPDILTSVFFVGPAAETVWGYLPGPARSALRRTCASLHRCTDGLVRSLHVLSGGGTLAVAALKFDNLSSISVQCSSMAAQDQDLISSTLQAELVNGRMLCEKLTRLCLVSNDSRCKISPAILAALPSLSALRDVKLDGRMKVTAEDLLPLAKCTSLHGFTKLSFGLTGHLEVLQDLHSLISLHLEHCNMPWAFISRLSALQNLELVDMLDGERTRELNDGRLPFEGHATLQCAGSLCALTRLRFAPNSDRHDPRVTREQDHATGNAALLAFSALTRLATLLLPDLRLDETGMAALGRIPTLVRLEVLGLSSPSSILLEHAGLPSLRELAVACGPVTPQQLVQLLGPARLASAALPAEGLLLSCSDAAASPGLSPLTRLTLAAELLNELKEGAMRDCTSALSSMQLSGVTTPAQVVPAAPVLVALGARGPHRHVRRLRLSGLSLVKSDATLLPRAFPRLVDLEVHLCHLASKALLRRYRMHLTNCSIVERRR